ncbi:MAG: hydroxymethylglutaryl-CoA reductase, partial [Saprospiraceae bacterium]
MEQKPKRSIEGFSKNSKRKKLEWVATHFFEDPAKAEETIRRFWLHNEIDQKLMDGISENTIGNFIMPFGIAPNFVINGITYALPMVIEESSVIAAASSAAKYWQSRGGFKATVISTLKVGQVHFFWNGDIRKWHNIWPKVDQKLRQAAMPITENMEKRGGGIRSIELLDFTTEEPNYYQLRVSFETCNSMGANFINSVLECFALELADIAEQQAGFTETEKDLNVLMSILSNYTPECLVKAEVSCPITDLGTWEGIESQELAERFYQAIRIAHIDTYRATTHNKGIFNGIDALVLATANDFRAIEACGHTYAARDGKYRSLSDCCIDDGIFHFWLEIPMNVGTVGGLTKQHPMADFSLQLLGNPDATTLMEMIAVLGLAQNFAAVRSLVTSG